MVLQLSYLYNRITYTWKDSLYVEMGPSLSYDKIIVLMQLDSSLLHVYIYLIEVWSHIYASMNPVSSLV